MYKNLDLSETSALENGLAECPWPERPWPKCPRPKGPRPKRPTFFKVNHFHGF